MVRRPITGRSRHAVLAALWLAIVFLQLTGSAYGAAVPVEVKSVDHGLVMKHLHLNPPHHNRYRCHHSPSQAVVDFPIPPIAHLEKRSLISAASIRSDTARGRAPPPRGGGNSNRGGGNWNRGGGNQNRGRGNSNRGGGNRNRGGGGGNARSSPRRGNNAPNRARAPRPNRARSRPAPRPRRAGRRPASRSAPRARPRPRTPVRGRPGSRARALNRPGSRPRSRIPTARRPAVQRRPSSIRNRGGGAARNPVGTRSRSRAGAGPTTRTLSRSGRRTVGRGSTLQRSSLPRSGLGSARSQPPGTSSTPRAGGATSTPAKSSDPKWWSVKSNTGRDLWTLAGAIPGAVIGGMAAAKDANGDVGKIALGAAAGATSMVSNFKAGVDLLRDPKKKEGRFGVAGMLAGGVMGGIVNHVSNQNAQTETDPWKMAQSINIGAGIGRVGGQFIGKSADDGFLKPWLGKKPKQEAEPPAPRPPLPAADITPPPAVYNPPNPGNVIRPPPPAFNNNPSSNPGEVIRPPPAARQR
ncbi:hypothetical protein HDU96_002513 [Phlyctochytrium bullatum]|nr:hypothetical protein HDU96_002513 [Phlyctochytrium bullatum]